VHRLCSLRLALPGTPREKEVNAQLLMLSGTQRPDCPLTVQTSCFKLVLAMQQAPLATGRPLFWGWGAAMAVTAKRARVAKNFMMKTVEGCESGYLKRWKSEQD
jgi:hypothetical protein